MVTLRHETKWWQGIADDTHYTVKFGAHGSKGQVKTKGPFDCKGRNPYRELELTVKDKLANGYEVVRDETTDEAPKTAAEDTPPAGGFFCELEYDFDALRVEATEIAHALGLAPENARDSWRVVAEEGELVLHRSFPVSFEIPSTPSRAALAGLALAVKRDAEVYGADGSVDPYDLLEAFFVAIQGTEVTRRRLHALGLMSSPTQIGPKLSQFHGIPVY